MQEYLLREACTRCGHCAQACPADAIFPLDGHWGDASGTPAIDARKQPCVLCDGYKCTQACPSGALQPLYGLAAIKMGSAVVHTSRCLTYQGHTCTACVEICPVPDAIGLDAEGHPVVNPHACVGCGLCVRACPTEPGALSIIPRD